MVTTEQLTQAVTLRAQDRPLREIEEATGIPRSTAHRILNRDDIQQLIKQSQLDLVGGSLRTAIKNQGLKIALSHKLLKDAGHDKNLPEHAKTLLELGDRAEGKLLESTGIHNAHTQSITLNQIMIDARSEMSPAVESLLLKHLGGDPCEVVDAEVDTSNPVDK